MDLGIAGRWALVCGASKGLGWGCAQALAREGVNLVLAARGAERLQRYRSGSCTSQGTISAHSAEV